VFFDCGYTTSSGYIKNFDDNETLSKLNDKKEEEPVFER